MPALVLLGSLKSIVPVKVQLVRHAFSMSIGTEFTTDCPEGWLRQSLLYHIFFISSILISSHLCTQESQAWHNIHRLDIYLR